MVYSLVDEIKKTFYTFNKHYFVLILRKYVKFTIKTIDIVATCYVITYAKTFDKSLWYLPSGRNFLTNYTKAFFYLRLCERFDTKIRNSVVFYKTWNLWRYYLSKHKRFQRKITKLFLNSSNSPKNIHMSADHSLFTWEKKTYW